MSRTVCVIPARMAATRYPGKPLAPLLKMPMIIHILRRCQLVREFERVIVATCDREIFDAVVAAGGEAVMTSDKHERCTDRVEEAIANLKLDLAADDFVLMVQGDEILVAPDMLCQMIEAYRSTGAPVINLISTLYQIEDHEDPNTVKAVFNVNRQLILLSRAPIPSRARSIQVPMYQQTGIIGFRASFLREFSSMPQTPLEKIESVDMLRVLENGHSIQVVTTDVETIGVDTPADLERAEKVLATDPTTARYLA